MRKLSVSLLLVHAETVGLDYGGFFREVVPDFNVDLSGSLLCEGEVCVVGPD